MPTFFAILLSSACMEQVEPSDDVGSAARPLGLFTWGNRVNVNLFTADLIKTTGGTGWNAGATSGIGTVTRGYVQFTTGENNRAKAAGLSHGNGGATLVDIDHAIYLHSDGTFSVSEGGIDRGIKGSYVAWDIFRVQVKGRVVTYWKNSALVYTSGVAPTLPLLVDASLYTVNATIKGAAIEEVEVHVSTQNSLLPDERLHCGANDVIAIQGSYLFAGQNQTLTTFLAKQQSQIVDQLEDVYIGQYFPEMADFDGTLILDMEHPVHPKDLYEQSSTDQDAIVQAWIRRIKAAKTVFPAAKLGMYGTLNPQSQGNPLATDYVLRLEALIEAGDEGLFEYLDYLVPVLYMPFGCNGAGSCDSQLHKLDEFTQLGVDGSRQLAELPLLPLLTVAVHNPTGSSFHGWYALDFGIAQPMDGTLGMQLDILAANEVHDAALWIGSSDNYKDDGNPNTDDAELDVADFNNRGSWVIDDYACAF